MSDLPVFALNVLITTPPKIVHFSLSEQLGRKCAIILIGNAQIPRKPTLAIFDFRPNVVEICERKRGKVLDEVEKAEILNCVNNPAQTCLVSFSINENDNEQQHIRIWLYPLRLKQRIVGNLTLELHEAVLKCKIVHEKDLPIRHAL